MKTRRTRGVGWVLLALAAWSAMLTPAARAADGEPMSPPALIAGEPLTIDLFDHILTRLQSIPPQDQDPRLVSFAGRLALFRDHRYRDRAAQEAAYEQALAKMTQRIAEDKLREALVAALEAHSQSFEPEQFLIEPPVQALVAQAEQAAAKAAEDGDWIEVMGLYRHLNLLFDPRMPYREQYKAAEQRVRILGLYAPDEIRRLQRERVQRRGEAEEKEIRPFDLDPWNKVLEGVELAMLQQVFEQLDKHVSGPSMSQFMLGAVDRLLLVLDSPGLSTTFPSLAEPARTQAFRGYLLNKRREIGAGEFGGLHGQTNLLISQILKQNAATVALPRNMVIYEIGEGAMASLDNFSEIIWPYQKEQLERSTRGNFSGVGIQISLSEDDRIKVVSPIAKSPARRAGIRAGDVVVTVNGIDTTSWTLDKAVRHITGPIGTQVKLGIERKGHDGLIDFTLKRASITIDSVWGWQMISDDKWSYYIDRQNKIGYVRLTQFVPQTTDDLDHAVRQMLNSDGLDGLILDLRFNPGGLLKQAVDITNRFVPSGRIVSTIGANKVQTSEFRARPDKAYPRMEVVVLINPGSASASEIVAGALQDYGRATIIGARSYGKGSVQDVFHDGADPYLKLTTQYYMLPAGRIIHREPTAETWGIEPDLVVPMTDQQVADAIEMRQRVDVLHDQGAPADADHPPAQAQEILDQGADPQLETALLYLQARLLADQMRLAHLKPAPANP